MILLKYLDVFEKRVFLRGDLDVPLKNGRVEDDWRLQNLQKYLKPVSIIIFVVLIVIAGFIYMGNRLRTSETRDHFQQVEQGKLILEVDGYGYTVGDIVQIKTGQPALGDVIVYDPFKNKSMCLGMGPSMSLGKTLGVPRETFSFQKSNLKIRAEIVELDRDYSQQKAVFGGQKYENLVAKNITLENGESLIDRWVGLECFAGELDETGSSISYNRFTVNEEAIIGIIVKKIGHDKRGRRPSEDGAASGLSRFNRGATFEIKSEFFRKESTKFNLG